MHAIASRPLVALALYFALSIPAAGAADKLVVLPFSGPTSTSIDPDMLWKHKTGMQAPTKEEVKNLPVTLSDALARKLSVKLGKLVVSADDLKKTMDDLGLGVTADHARRNSELAQKLDAAYLVEGNVDRIEFDGNTVMHDKYAMFVTVKLLPTDKPGAAPLYSLTNKKFYQKVKAVKGRAIATVFTEDQIPTIADTLADQITQALGR